MSLSDFGAHLVVAFSLCVCVCVVKAPVERKYHSENTWKGETGEETVRCVCSFYGKRNCRRYAALLYRAHCVGTNRGVRCVEICESNS